MNEEDNGSKLVKEKKGI